MIKLISVAKPKTDLAKMYETMKSGAKFIKEEFGEDVTIDLITPTERKGDSQWKPYHRLVILTWHKKSGGYPLPVYVADFYPDMPDDVYNLSWTKGGADYEDYREGGNGGKPTKAYLDGKTYRNRVIAELLCDWFADVAGRGAKRKK